MSEWKTWKAGGVPPIEFHGEFPTDAEVFAFTEGPHKGTAIPEWLLPILKSGDRVKYVTTGRPDAGTWYVNDVEMHGPSKLTG